MRLAALSGLTLAAATLVLAVLAALHRGRARGLALVLAAVLFGASVVVPIAAGRTPGVAGAPRDTSPV